MTEQERLQIRRLAYEVAAEHTDRLKPARGTLGLLLAGAVVWAIVVAVVLAAVPVFAADSFGVSLADTEIRTAARHGVHEGDVDLLTSSVVPGGLIGRRCDVSARSVNVSNPSLHPDNDLLVESASTVRLADVESGAGTVYGPQPIDLGASVTVSLVMGPDEKFSAGLVLEFDCPPPPTTTTTTTTEVPPSTTSTTSTSTTEPDSTSTSTTSTPTSTTSTTPTSPATTTTAPNSTSTSSTSPSSTSSTSSVPDTTATPTTTSDLTTTTAAPSTTPTTTTAPSSTTRVPVPSGPTAPPTRELPPTGRTEAWWMLVGAACVAAGVGASRIARRR